MDLEDGVRALWKQNIYAEGGMGCTGPMILVSEANCEKAEAILKEAGLSANRIDPKDRTGPHRGRDIPA